jgi:trehalose/maltose transport system substrate-binding protein
VPWATNAAFLYYRTDQVSQPPKTWQDAYADAKDNDGIVYQGAAYEGLTCHYLELAYAAGDEILSADGKKAVIDSPQNLQALQLMVDGVKNGTAVNGVTTYMEERSCAASSSPSSARQCDWPSVTWSVRVAPLVLTVTGTRWPGRA